MFGGEVLLGIKSDNLYFYSAASTLALALQMGQASKAKTHSTHAFFTPIQALCTHCCGSGLSSLLLLSELVLRCKENSE